MTSVLTTLIEIAGVALVIWYLVSLATLGDREPPGSSPPGDRGRPPNDG